MFDDLFNKINFTSQEKKVLDYILSSPQDIILFSIKDLSSKTGVSEATISRFSRHSGFKDFKDMKTAIINRINSLNSPEHKIKKSISMHDSSSIDKILNYQRDCIKKTLGHNNDDDTLNLTSDLISAKKIYIYGKGASLPLSEYLLFRLKRFGLNVFLINGGVTEIFEDLNHIDDDCFVILFGFLKLGNEGKIILDYCSRRNIKTLHISSRLSDKDNSTYHLYVYRGEPLEYHSMAPAMAIIDSIVIKTASLIGDHSSKMLKSLHDLKKEYSTFNH